MIEFLPMTLVLKLFALQFTFGFSVAKQATKLVGTQLYIVFKDIDSWR